MPKACPEVHSHPAFELSYDKNDPEQKRYKTRLIERLKSGNQAGLKKGGNLQPLYGFPEGHVSVRMLYVKCGDCQKNLFKSKCSFCEGPTHSMDDAVLFFSSGSHDYKQALNKFEAVKNPSFK